ncbi:hypothetical protein B0H10DRAFT_1878452, partial [Mycena sp. CBHHK59/15]
MMIDTKTYSQKVGLDIILTVISFPTFMHHHTSSFVDSDRSSLTMDPNSPREEALDNNSDGSHSDDSSLSFLAESGAESAVLSPSSRVMHHHMLRLICLVSHLTLILLHFMLVGVWAAPHLEHKIVFSVDLQSTVSLAVTAITTTFGTAYFALLVFVTQKLAFHRNLHKQRTLTSMHDNATAWTGFGSALANLLNQVSVPASVISGLCVLMYLGSISVLHITTPSLFAI